MTGSSPDGTDHETYPEGEQTMQVPTIIRGSRPSSRRLRRVLGSRRRLALILLSALVGVWGMSRVVDWWTE
jgi:hypothetical protein